MNDNKPRYPLIWYAADGGEIEVRFERQRAVPTVITWEGEREGLPSPIAHGETEAVHRVIVTGMPFLSSNDLREFATHLIEYANRWGADES